MPKKHLINFRGTQDFAYVTGLRSNQRITDGGVIWTFCKTYAVPDFVWIDKQTTSIEIVRPTKPHRVPYFAPKKPCGDPTERKTKELTFEQVHYLDELHQKIGTMIFGHILTFDDWYAEYLRLTEIK